MKIVLDTNVLSSALIRRGKLGRIIRSKRQLITSEEILEELAAVSNEPNIQEISLGLG